MGTIIVLGIGSLMPSTTLVALIILAMVLR